jgi:hypothetical protein
MIDSALKPAADHRVFKNTVAAPTLRIKKQSLGMQKSSVGGRRESFFLFNPTPPDARAG